MADRLTPLFLVTLRAIGVSAGIAAAASAGAQALSDPTRPPNATPYGVPEEETGGRQLQSILFSGGRKLAIIDGKTIPLGGMLGDAKIVRITETEVTLQTGKETEVLKLYPTIEKQPVKRAGARTAGKAPGPDGRGGAK